LTRRGGMPYVGFIQNAHSKKKISPLHLGGKLEGGRRIENKKGKEGGQNKQSVRCGEGRKLGPTRCKTVAYSTPLDARWVVHARTDTPEKEGRQR